MREVVAVVEVRWDREPVVEERRGEEFAGAADVEDHRHPGFRGHRPDRIEPDVDLPRLRPSEHQGEVAREVGRSTKQVYRWLRAHKLDPGAHR